MLALLLNSPRRNSSGQQVPVGWQIGKVALSTYMDDYAVYRDSDLIGPRDHSRLGKCYGNAASLHGLSQYSLVGRPAESRGWKSTCFLQATLSFYLVSSLPCVAVRLKFWRFVDTPSRLGYKTSDVRPPRTFHE